MILFAIVVYNIDLNACTTLQTLRKSLRLFDFPFKVLVIDNSDGLVPHTEASGCYDYYTVGYNAGLATAYRYAIEHGARVNADYLVTFDQDSVVSANYLAALSAVAAARADDFSVIYCPKIFCLGKQVSPYGHGFLGRMTFDGTSKFAINSFTIYPRSALPVIAPTDDFYWLDALDFVIFRRLAGRGFRIEVLDVVVEHNLSLAIGRVTWARLTNILFYEAAFLFEYCNAWRIALGLSRLILRLFRHISLRSVLHQFGLGLRAIWAGSSAGLRRRGRYL